MRGRDPKQPLAGRRIVITRQREQAAGLRTALEKRGARVIELPTIALAPPRRWALLDRALRKLNRYDWVVFTSANGVEFFFSRLKQLGLDARPLRWARIAAIGPATAAALRRHRVHTELVPSEFRAEGLLAAFSKERWRGRRVLLARAARARALLPKELRHRGAHVDVLEAYRTVLPRENPERARKILSRGRPDLITFTSSSTVRNFFALLGRRAARRALQDVTVASIGPVTSRTARALGLQVAVEAKSYTVAGLVQAVEDYLCSRTLRG